VLRIGLTGGIASGKSLVATLFVECGASLVDTDVIAREVVAPGTPGLEAVLSEFGESLRLPDGRLDRRTLRAIVFADPEARARLEAIVHPLVRSRTIAAIASADGPYVVVAVPLLVETNFRVLVDRVLVVACDRDQQIDRLVQRDGIDRDLAIAMIDAQIDPRARLEQADDVIDNSSTIDATRRQVNALHERYLALADDCRPQPRHAE
jgi:dephospho-CoA kinase